MKTQYSNEDVRIVSQITRLQVELEALSKQTCDDLKELKDSYNTININLEKFKETMLMITNRQENQDKSTVLNSRDFENLKKSFEATQKDVNEFKSFIRYSKLILGIFGFTSIASVINLIILFKQLLA